MKKTVIFGAGHIGQRLCLNLQTTNVEMVFTDNDPKLWNTEITLNNIGYKVISPEKIKSLDYNKIHIAVKGARNEVYIQCVAVLNVNESNIDCTYLDNFVNGIDQWQLKARNWFLECYSKLAYEKNLPGAVAEVGVYRGAFAKEINRLFPDRKIYLYDTFEGFDKRDIEKEIDLSTKNDTRDKIDTWRKMLGNFENTSEDYVVSQLPHPENCVLRKGYFPDTFNEDREQFCFVNLDCDLYNPIYSGLEKFYPRMVRGG